uniref:Uncharacterized protein n=1 Tax=Romanomermis culicivorax TaxID=13658 RepID=A0A915HT70_ROMCU
MSNVRIGRGVLSIQRPTDAAKSKTAIEFIKPFTAVNCKLWFPMLPRTILNANIHIRSPWNEKIPCTQAKLVTEKRASVGLDVHFKKYHNSNVSWPKRNNELSFGLNSRYNGTNDK